jgi:hypothetical protein
MQERGQLHAWQRWPGVPSGTCASKGRMGRADGDGSCQPATNIGHWSLEGYESSVQGSGMDRRDVSWEQIAEQGSITDG